MAQPPEPGPLVREMPKDEISQNGPDGGLRVLRPLLDGAGRDAAQPLKGDLKQRIIKTTVGICLKGHTPPESYHDRMLMFRHMGAREAEQFHLKEPVLHAFNYASAGEIFVPYAREQLCDIALAWDSDYVFMIDDDMLAPPDLFYQLVKHEKDVVAALAFTRNPPHNPVIYECIKGYDPVARSAYGRNVWVHNYPRNQLVECDAVGFGAVLIKTDILKKMKKPWFMGVHGAGEDITFCYKAKEAGFRVFMDTAQKLGHLGHPTIITEEYVDHLRGISDEERDRLYGAYNRHENFKLR